MKQEIVACKRLVGEINVPPDKSISHRAVMLASIAEGISTITQPLLSEDVQRTITAFRNMGIEIDVVNSYQLRVHGKGLFGLQRPTSVIDVGNSGTTIRLLMGILAAQPFSSVLMGDDSISRRPMGRVTEPLKLMGAYLHGMHNGSYTPITIHGGSITGITYPLPIASAQVKSAILLAALYTEGSTTVIEPAKTRDHTERMLRHMGVEVSQDNTKITVSQQKSIQSMEVKVPGDFSSAAFFIAAALIVPESEIVLHNVGINPTRIGFLTVLEKMGAHIEFINVEQWGEETVADIRVRSQALQGTRIAGELIPLMIDELPIIALLATQSEGTTEIRNAEELKVKESNRITAVVSELQKLGADIVELHDGMKIKGKTQLKGANVMGYGDHRIAMTLSIAGLIAQSKTVVDGVEAVNISYPSFFADLHSLI